MYNLLSKDLSNGILIHQHNYQKSITQEKEMLKRRAEEEEARMERALPNSTQLRLCREATVFHVAGSQAVEGMV